MISPNCERAIGDALSIGNAILKFISANDVDLTGGHQCGYYLPKPVWQMFTDIGPTRGVNEETKVHVQWQDGRTTDSRVKWYGDKTRSEYRLTRFGRDFPFRTFDNVGDLLVLIPVDLSHMRAYVLDQDEDIEEIQLALGVEIIGGWAAYKGGSPQAPESPDECVDRSFRRFADAHDVWPNTAAFALATRETLKKCLKTFDRMLADERLIRLVENEYRLFRLVERQLCAQEIIRPFKDVDDFLSTASTIANRRKSRAGRSLENHVGFLLNEMGIPFESRARIDGKVEPDILIPCKAAYEDPSFPIERLCVLGVKTTCKDRWRQVLNEGKRVPRKHILTMQPGISANQLNEMQAANVTLIVPEPLLKEYPKDSRATILTVEQFIRSAQVITRDIGSLFDGRAT